MSLDEPTGVPDWDPDPFVVLYRAEYPGMVRLAHALTGSAETAEDLVQEAFLRLQSHLASLPQPGGYLRTTVVNLCRDRARREGRRRRVDGQWREGVQLSPSSAELLDVLRRLPERQRTVLVLRYWGDWTEAEIATALGCAPGTVKALASRGLARLRKEVPA